MGICKPNMGLDFIRITWYRTRATLKLA